MDLTVVTAVCMLPAVQYKLAVFDIDGTLLGPRTSTLGPASGRTVPDSAAAAIGALVELGVAVAVGTARPYHVALGPFEELGVRGEAITSSGADVRRADGTVVAQERLSLESARFLAELCDRAAWTPTVGTIDGMVMRLDEMPEWLDRAPPTTRVVRSLADELPEGMLSIVTGVDGAPSLVRELEAHPELSVQRAFTRDGGVLVSVTRAGVDKGTGLLALCGSLGIRREEAVAFGDAEVDVPMFVAAGLGVAMGNADDETKAKADLVTSDVLEDGVANAVREIWGV